MSNLLKYIKSSALFSEINSKYTEKHVSKLFGILLNVLFVLWYSVDSAFREFSKTCQNILHFHLYANYEKQNFFTMITNNVDHYFMSYHGIF